MAVYSNEAVSLATFQLLGALMTQLQKKGVLADADFVSIREAVTASAADKEQKDEIIGIMNDLIKRA